jgi:hypothetical protein
VGDYLISQGGDAGKADFTFETRDHQRTLVLVYPGRWRFLGLEIRLLKPPSRGLDQAKFTAVPRRIVVDAIHRVEFDDAPKLGGKYSKQLLRVAMRTDGPETRKRASYRS